MINNATIAGGQPAGKRGPPTEESAQIVASSCLAECGSGSDALSRIDIDYLHGFCIRYGGLSRREWHEQTLNQSFTLSECIHRASVVENTQ